MFDGFFYQLPQLEAEKVYVFGVADSDQITDDDFETLESLLSEDEQLEVSSIFSLPARRTALLAFALRRYVLCYYLGKEPNQLEFFTQESGRLALKGNRLFQFDLMNEGVAAFALSMNAAVGLCTEKHAMTSKTKALQNIATLRSLGNYQRDKSQRRRLIWSEDEPYSSKSDGIASTWIGEVAWQSAELSGHESLLSVTVQTDKPRELQLLLCLPERVLTELTEDAQPMSQKTYRYFPQP